MYEQMFHLPFKSHLKETGLTSMTLLTFVTSPSERVIKDVYKHLQLVAARNKNDNKHLLYVCS